MPTSSLIFCHIILVISSPSSSTTGFLTLIFCPAGVAYPLRDMAEIADKEFRER